MLQSADVKFDRELPNVDDLQVQIGQKVDELMQVLPKLKKMRRDGRASGERIRNAFLSVEAEILTDDRSEWRAVMTELESVDSGDASERL